MLVNLRIKPGQRTKWKKFSRELLRDKFYTRKWNYIRKDIRLRKNHFNWIIHPYTPCGLEYEKDTVTKFTGVYIDTFGLAESYIPALTYNKVVHTLVGYGNVDNASQAIEEYEKLKKRHPEDVVGNHVIILKPIIKGRSDGFRWHKNGYYQGKAPAGGYEYFDDEPCEDLKMVYNYNIIQVSTPKEEDFGDVPAKNFGRISGIRKLRLLGLKNLAAYAKTCGYVACGDGGCWTEDQNDKEMFFEFNYDNNNNLVSVVPFPSVVEPDKLASIPDVDWSK